MKKVFVVELILVTSFLVSSCTKRIPLPIPHAEKIEAISVAGADNIIVKVEHVTFGVGVGAGLGAPQISCKTEEQFLELIPKGAKIYTSVNKVDNYTVVRRYLSTSEKEGLVFVYEIPVECKNEGGWTAWVESFDDEQVIFRYN